MDLINLTKCSFVFLVNQTCYEVTVVGLGEGRGGAGAQLLGYRY